MNNNATEHILRAAGISRRVINSKAADLGLATINRFCMSESFRNAETGRINSLILYAKAVDDIPLVYSAVHLLLKNAHTALQKSVITFDLIKLADCLDAEGYVFNPTYNDEYAKSIYQHDVIGITSFCDSDRPQDALTNAQRERVRAFTVHMINQGKAVIFGVYSTKLDTANGEWGVNFMHMLTKTDVRPIRIPIQQE